MRWILHQSRCAEYNCSSDCPPIRLTVQLPPPRLRAPLCARIFSLFTFPDPVPQTPAALQNGTFMFKTLLVNSCVRSEERPSLCTFIPSGTRTASGSACWPTARRGRRRELDHTGRSRDSCCPTWHSHSARHLLVAEPQVTYIGLGPGTAVAPSAQILGAGAAVCLVAACWPGTAAGTSRWRPSVRWRLGRRSCRLAHRIPVLYAPSQSRTNRALCLRRRKRVRDNLPS